MTAINNTESALVRFSIAYKPYHGYLSLCVCLLGILANVFNITVLTRRKMQTQINQILTGLAISDIITMMSYVPFAIHFYCMYLESSPKRNSYGWMSFLLFHISLTTVTHSASIWLCVVLAIIRYRYIRCTRRMSSTASRQIMHAKYIVFVVFILSAIAMIPNYLTTELTQREVDSYSLSIGVNTTDTNQEKKFTIVNETIWVLKSLQLGSEEARTLVLVNVWTYAVMAKLAPCFLMTLYGSLLLQRMHRKFKQRRHVLKISLHKSAKLHEHSRTTLMLITVFTLFTLAELPQGILIVLSASKKGFFKDVYMPLGDLMDMVALLNNAINFILYCSMSKMFRETFTRLYCNCCFPRADELGMNGNRRNDGSGHEMTLFTNSRTLG